MELRLFPLRTVLFPGMALPLQVFEQRYRQLVAECVETSEPFGIVLIKEGAEVAGPAVPHALGTTALIESVAPTPSGRLQVHVVGGRRFRIAELHHDRPYLWADVEYPVDEGVEAPVTLMKQAHERYSTLVQLHHTAAGGYAREVATLDSPGALADTVGAALNASPDELQQLLETVDARRRLERAVALLEPAIAAAHREATLAVRRRYGSLASLN